MQECWVADPQQGSGFGVQGSGLGLGFTDLFHILYARSTLHTQFSIAAIRGSEGPRKHTKSVRLSEFPSDGRAS